MSANLPPQFFAISKKLKNTKDPEEKISILEELLAIVPKHKGTERVQQDLKTKIAKLKKQKTKKSKKEILYVIKKEEAGQIVIIGPANAGKSSLLNVLTNAETKVASYPFTTQIPKPAMMPYENVLIQLVDTPPLTKESPPWLKGILKASDGLLAIFDLSEDSVVEDIKNLKELLSNWGLANKKIIFLGNKIDLKESRENLKKIKPHLRVISCLKKIGIEELKKEIFDLLEIIRVYTRSVNKPKPDFENPFVIKKGSKLIDLANQIHKDFSFSFKKAKLFKKDSKKFQIVGKDYILQDHDIVEIHA